MPDGKRHCAIVLTTECRFRYSVDPATPDAYLGFPRSLDHMFFRTPAKPTSSHVAIYITS